MALIRCVECKAKVSDKATTCPKCGAPIEISKKKAKGQISKGCGFIIILIAFVGIFAGVISSFNTSQSPSKPSTEAASPVTKQEPKSVTVKQKPMKTPQYSGQPMMVRVSVNDDTQTRQVHAKTEIWFRGYGSWWLKRELKYGGTVKNLGTRPSGIKQTLIIYPESRDGKELKVPYMMTDEMNPKGSPRDMISVDISDTEITVHGLPIKAASGQFEMKYKR